MNVRKMDNISVMNDALARINAERYGGNVTYYTIDPDGTGYHFRLTATDSRGLGSKFSHSGRRIGVGACWHAYGYLFEAVLALAPDSYFKSAYSDRIDINGGNWQDVNIGSMYSPLMASQQCECDERGVA